MSSRYFYLKVEIDLKSAARPELEAQQILQQATQELFGECSGVGVDILHVYSAQGLTRILVRVRDTQLRKLRAAIALCSRNIRVAMSTAEAEPEPERRQWRLGADGRHALVVATRGALAAPSRVRLPPAEPAPGLLRPDGSINWGCPCLGGMATGPCALQFRDAFSCFHYSEAEPKGSECYEKFSVMQDCMARFPQLYGKDDDDDPPRDPLAASAGDGGDARDARDGRESRDATDATDATPAAGHERR